MKFNKIIAMFFIGLIICGNLFAASATMQITDYSTTPEVLYPGSTGYLQVTLNNAGSVAADTVTIYYDYGVDENTKINVGSIGAGSSSMTTIPFSVPKGTSSGVLPIHLTIYYGYSSEGDKTGNVKSTISVPISQRQIIEVNTLSIDKTSISPGDLFTVDLEVKNSGGTTQNIIIKSASDSSFSIEGTSQKSIGSIDPYSVKNISITLRADSDSESGKFTVPLVFEYQDSSQNTVSETVYIGPISVTDSSAQFNIQLNPVSDIGVGSQAEFELVVENRGSTDASIIIELNSDGDSIFTPIGSNKIYIDNLNAAEIEKQIIYIGIDPSASAGYYSYPLQITANGKTYMQYTGIEVVAEQEITLSYKTDSTSISPGSSVVVSAQIANTGNSAIRSVYSKVSGSDGIKISGTADKFIGTLSVDDFSTFQFTLEIPQNIAAGTYKIPVQIIFKDGLNQEHTITENVELIIQSQGLLSTGETQISNTMAATSTNFKGKQNFGILGFGSLVDMVIAGAVLVLAYFGYKKYYGGNKK